MESQIDANDFVNDVKKMRMSYSYIPVLIFAFFSECDQNGIAELDAIAQYFKRYYAERRNKGEPVEKSDSIFCDADVSLGDVKKNILFNPLGRSFLVNYISYYDIDNTVRMQPDVWEALSIRQVKQVLAFCNRSLFNYFQKLKDGYKHEKG